MKAIKKSLHKILISDSWGFNEIIAPKIVTIIESFSPDYYVFLSPSVFEVYFSIGKKEEEITVMIENIKNIVKQNSNFLENTIIRKAVDSFIFELDKKNRIVDIPLGGMNIYKKESIIFENIS